ncbi:MAG: ABC transporter permease subunit, partial [Meiothermus sp.]|nr:ABC transporter permease subunit [Meiothermus sp.]
YKRQSLSTATAVLAEATLSFLGLGVQPPTPSWGSMLNDARGYLSQAPHMALFPGLAIFLAVLAFNLIGDGLRDAFDPRMKK